jgi:hypothetical protein
LSPDGRGWVIQEEILSRRGLLFGSEQMSWRCLCGRSLGDSPNYKSVPSIADLHGGRYVIDGPYHPPGDDFNEFRLWLIDRDPLPDRDRSHRNNQFDQWYEMVEKYSRRSLAVDRDVLPALSGLASAMAKTHNCTYITGLWAEDLQVELAWYVEECKKRGLGIGCSTISQEALDIPSWSWASCRGKTVEFRGWQYNASHI